MRRLFHPKCMFRTHIHTSVKIRFLKYPISPTSNIWKLVVSWCLFMNVWVCVIETDVPLNLRCPIKLSNKKRWKWSPQVNTCFSESCQFDQDMYLYQTLFFYFLGSCQVQSKDFSSVTIWYFKWKGPHFVYDVLIKFHKRKEVPEKKVI